jgi:hypothetical protein
MGTMVTAHTYYLARWDRCYGERAQDGELCSLLKREWMRHAHDVEPTIVDGVSAWIDQDGVVRVCLVRMAAAQMIADPDLATELEPYLAEGRDADELTSGPSRERPGHRPASPR